ncbi:glycosyltransferase family 4 protein [Enterococcus durans]|uniref:glycosyltransferase n=1 Tax=Enterococcus durans TaxID=53345 RepID=UPI0018835C6E|nr:glycosyltransferase [Enterococcus durans]MBE9886274.1 glycosyltransferase family 4 protein [Enterococcus durans]
MNICFLSGNYKIGGAEKVAVEIGKCLNQDFSVFFFGFNGNSNEYNIANENIKFNKEKNFFSKVSNKIFKEYNFIRKGGYVPSDFNIIEIENFVLFCDEYSIDCIVFNQGNMITLIPEIKKRLKNTDTKLISWVHSNYEIYEKKYFKKCKKSLNEGLVLSDAVICLTPDDKNEYVKLNSMTFFIPNPLTISSDEKADLSTKNIILTSRVNFKTKGIDYLFPISKQLPDGWNIVVAGPMTKISKTQKLFYSIKNRSFKKIKFVGKKSGIELVQHYLSGSIFLSTSRWEGFGLSITEAMSFGLPIITFDTLGPKYILDEGKYGVIVSKNNVDDMIKQINILINDEQLREEYANLAYKRSEDFKVGRIYLEWKKVFEKIELVNSNGN